MRDVDDKSKVLLEAFARRAFKGERKEREAGTSEASELSERGRPAEGGDEKDTKV